MLQQSHGAMDQVAIGLHRHCPLNEADWEAIRSLPNVAMHVSRELDVHSPTAMGADTCLVESGLVGSVAFTKEGKRQIIAVFTPGELCNTGSIVAQETSTRLVALSASDVRWLKGPALMRLTEESIAITKSLWRLSALQSAVLKEWVVNLGRRFASERVAHLLCEMACRYAPPEPKDGLEFTFPVTQEQIADIVGLTTVRVNHSLKNLRSSGAAKFRRGQVKVLNWELLAHKGDFSPHYLPMVGNA